MGNEGRAGMVALVAYGVHGVGCLLVGAIFLVRVVVDVDAATDDGF
jgi:hypothetical protein